MITVSITNRQRILPVDRRRIRQAVRAIVRDAGFVEARIGVAIVDDAAIARLHGEFLHDPTPTDVLSFTLERSKQALEGEIVASAETAIANARRYDCPAEQELLLYVVHGALHLVGYDDATPRRRAAMRKKEQEYTRQRKTGIKTKIKDIKELTETRRTQSKRSAKGDRLRARLRNRN